MMPTSVFSWCTNKCLNKKRRYCCFSKLKQMSPLHLVTETQLMIKKQYLTLVEETIYMISFQIRKKKQQKIISMLLIQIKKIWCHLCCFILGYKGYLPSIPILFVCLMVFNDTFNNISVISWRSVLMVEETRGPGENHRPIASH